MIRIIITVFFVAFLGSLKLHSQSNCGSFSSYFGGTQFDEIKGICVDANKNSYIIGNTYSTDLPITTGLINDTHLGSYEVFLAKVDSCGAPIWCTYFGTPNFDSGEKITLSADGNIVFCGYSSGINLPVSSGCFQSSNNGGYDCFITKITPNGHIIWSTYFGKTNGDFAYDIKTDALNNVIIGGTTTSTNLYTTASSFQPNHKGNTDAFIARFSKDGILKWCTYYGGNNNEDIHALAVDNNYNIIGTGGTFSSNLNTSSNAYQTINEGSPDAYIIKLDSNCARVFSTYFGGSGIEDAWGVATDASNNIYLAGNTNSTDFDTTMAAYQTTLNGTLSDWYLSKWSDTGLLLNSTLFGGSTNDLSCRLQFLQPNILLFLGKTESIDMPIIGINNQQNNAGNYDVFLTAFNASNLQPFWSSYYGGTLDEDPIDICAGSNNTIEFVGITNSVDYPLSATPYQNTLNASNDGAITKLQIQSSISTKINNQAILSEPNIFPNPFHDYLLVNETQTFSVDIKNILGQSILTSQNNQTIDTRTFDQGVYLIRLETKHYSRTYKFIKN